MKYVIELESWCLRIELEWPTSWKFLSFELSIAMGNEKLCSKMVLDGMLWPRLPGFWMLKQLTECIQIVLWTLSKAVRIHLDSSYIWARVVICGHLTKCNPLSLWVRAFEPNSWLTPALSLTDIVLHNKVFFTAPLKLTEPHAFECQFGCPKTLLCKLFMPPFFFECIDTEFFIIMALSPEKA